jgi:hypothetical protein
LALHHLKNIKGEKLKASGFFDLFQEQKETQSKTEVIINFKS